jgi:hypothetical protein
MWLDWRRDAPLETAVGAGGWAVVQIGTIIAAYAFALASGAILLLGVALIIALGSLVIIAVGNRSNG